MSSPDIAANIGENSVDLQMDPFRKSEAVLAERREETEDAAHDVVATVLDGEDLVDALRIDENLDEVQREAVGKVAVAAIGVTLARTVEAGRPLSESQRRLYVELRRRRLERAAAARMQAATMLMGVSYASANAHRAHIKGMDF